MGLIESGDLAQFLAEHPDWLFEDDAVQRTFQFADFAEALDFVNRVGEIAEAANHHPDIDIRWNRVRLRLTTHSEGGLTEMDVAMAARIDGLI